jgi:hypothetical protein
MTNAEKSKQNQDKLSKKEASKDTKCQGKGPGFQSLNSDAAVHMLQTEGVRCMHGEIQKPWPPNHRREVLRA